MSLWTSFMLKWMKAYLTKNINTLEQTTKIKPAPTGNVSLTTSGDCLAKPKDCTADVLTTMKNVNG